MAVQRRCAGAAGCACLCPAARRPAAGASRPRAQEQPAEAAAPDAEAPTEEAAQPAEEAPAGETADPQRTYVALGDSIVSGVGLPDFKYTEAAIGIDAAPNFEGYPEQCYVSLVGKGLGLDRQHAINLGLPGLTTGDLADMLHTGAMPQMNQQGGHLLRLPPDAGLPQARGRHQRADRLQRWRWCPPLWRWATPPTGRASSW